jgi:uncharacterized protein (DUF362 family)
MTEEVENETLEIIKLLVEKIERLEQIVYDKDNLLMKSGLVKVDTPTPKVSTSVDGIDSNTISKMSWGEINTMVKKMEGQ